MLGIFFLIFFGVNLTFFPLHFAGMHGYPRKYLDYPDVYSVWNILSSFGSMISVFSLFLFVYLIVDSLNNRSYFLSEEFTNGGSEGSLCFYVFNHCYLEDVSF